MQQQSDLEQQQSDLEQQQMHHEQQQMQQQLKATQQLIHLEPLKWKEEAAVAKTHLEAMFDALCWGGFDNISADGLPASAEKVGMHLSRDATSSLPIHSV